MNNRSKKVKDLKIKILKEKLEKLLKKKVVLQEINPPHWEGKSIYNKFLTEIFVPLYITIDYDSAIEHIISSYSYNPDICLERLNELLNEDFDWSWRDFQRNNRPKEDEEESDEEEGSGGFKFQPRMHGREPKSQEEESEDLFEKFLNDEIWAKRNSRANRSEKIQYSGIEIEEFYDALKDDFNESKLEQYIDKHNNFNNNDILSLRVTGIYNDSGIIISVISSKELDKDELDRVKSYLSGQFSDGWGEGFEQREFIEGIGEPDRRHRGQQVETKRYYVHTWVSGQKEPMRIIFSNKPLQ